MIRASLALGLALLSWAAVAEPQSAAAPLAAATSLGSLLQVLLALFLVIAAIVATAWLLRRFGPTQLGPDAPVKVLGGVAVGPRERLVLVEVGETWLVVGVAPGRVSAVHSMPRPAGGQVEAAVPAASSFAERLKQMLGGRRT